MWGGGVDDDANYDVVLILPPLYFFVPSNHQQIMIIPWCSISLSWLDPYLPIPPTIYSYSISIIYISLTGLNAPPSFS